MTGLTYEKSGVSIAAGDAFVRRIAPLCAATRTPEVIDGVGGFAGLCRVPSDIANPILVSSTDGVGTKLRVAFMAGRHDTIGIDLVAMCVNDLLTTGARPLFFLDYFSCGRLDPEQAAEVVSGISRGCKQSGCALIGGETAEMPGSYADGEYDLAGFAVGVVGEDARIDIESVRPGDVLVGLASSGLHSNGYSLARAILFERMGLDLHARPEGLQRSVLEELLAPTRIYADVVARLLRVLRPHAICHVTGGGIPGNLARVLPPQCDATLDPKSWRRPPVFEFLRQHGGVPEDDMWQTFNMGIGLILAVAPEDVAGVCSCAREAQEEPYVIGKVVPRDDGASLPRVRWA